MICCVCGCVGRFVRSFQQGLVFLDPFRNGSSVTVFTVFTVFVFGMKGPLPEFVDQFGRESSSFVFVVVLVVLVVAVVPRCQDGQSEFLLGPFGGKVFGNALEEGPKLGSVVFLLGIGTTSTTTRSSTSCCWRGRGRSWGVVGGGGSVG